MNVVSSPSLVKEDIPSVHELHKQAQAGRTGIRFIRNQINQMLDKSR
jgi:hypothetical protein